MDDLASVNKKYQMCERNDDSTFRLSTNQDKILFTSSFLYIPHIALFVDEEIMELHCVGFWKYILVEWVA